MKDIKIYDQNGIEIATRGQKQFETKGSSSLQNWLSSSHRKERAIINNAKLEDLKHQIDTTLEIRTAERKATTERILREIEKERKEAISLQDLDLENIMHKLLVNASNQTQSQKEIILALNISDDDKNEMLQDVYNSYCIIKRRIKDRFQII